MKQRSPTFNGDYQRPMTPKRYTQTWRIPEWLAASGLTIGKQSTSFDFARACQHKDSLKTSKGKARQQRPRNHQKASPLVSQASRITGLINSTWDNPVDHRRGLLERQANWIAQASFQPLTTLEKEGSTRKARDSNPLFNLSHPTQSKELYSDTLQGPLSEQEKWPFKFLSVLSPYSRKPGLFGPNVSICAKGVSRGVHNIAFSLSPDNFRAIDLFFLGWLATLKQWTHWDLTTQLYKNSSLSERHSIVCQSDHFGLQQPSPSLLMDYHCCSTKSASY